MIYNVDRLVQEMAKHDLDLLVISSIENINYFSGIRPVIKTLNRYYGECYIVIDIKTPSKVNFVHSCGECDQLTESKAALGLVVTYGTFFREKPNDYKFDGDEESINEWTMRSPPHANGRDALLSLISAIAPRSNARIGYDQDGMPSGTMSAMKSVIGANNCVESSDIIRNVRKIKTPYEIQGLERAARINEQAIVAVTQELHIGISERDLKEIFELELIKQGGRPELTMLKIGASAVGGQRQQRDDIKLRSGDLVWFDSNTSFQGFWADLARVVAYQDVAEDTLTKYNSLRDGMMHAAEIAKPGVTGSRVFTSTMEFIRERGFESYRRHHIGHGIGFEAYERPIISPAEDCEIEAGMVISIETPYYEFGLGALHIEDPLLIGKTDNNFLTNSPCPELLVIN